MSGPALGVGMGLGYSGGARLLPRRLVATRGVIASKNQIFQGNEALSQSVHFKRGGDRGIGIRIANWFATETATSTETAPTNPVTVSAAIEWPIGAPRTPLTFAGAPTALIPAGADLDTDIADIDIPDGAKFLVFIKRTGAAGLVNAFFGLSANAGDAMQYGTSVAGTALTGVPVNTGPQKFGPLAVFARSARPAALLLGDSRQIGLNDIGDISGDTGEFARRVGPHLGYANVGVGGSRAEGFDLTRYARRIALARDFCTHLYCAFGVNDIRGGIAATTIAGYLAGIYAAIDLPACQGTIAPVTTGAWTNADGSDQVLNAFNANRLMLNTSIRALGIPGLTAMADIAGVLENTANSGKWKADGTPARYTDDGTHEVMFANLAIAASGVIPLPGTF